jgi:hypothetical protein
VILLGIGVVFLVFWNVAGQNSEDFNGDQVSDLSMQTEVYNAAQARIAIDHPTFRSENFSGFSSAIVREREGLYTVLVQYRDYQGYRKFLCTMSAQGAPRPRAAPPGTYYTSGRWSVYCAER